MALQPMNDNDDIQDIDDLEPEPDENFTEIEKPVALPADLQLRRDFEIFTLFERDKHTAYNDRKWHLPGLAKRYGLTKRTIHEIIWQTRRLVDWEGNIPHMNCFAAKVDENSEPIIASRQRFPTRSRKGWMRWVTRFLAIYAQTGNMTESCRRARVSKQTVRDHQKNDPAFARQMMDAYESSIELKEKEVDRRAFEGMRVKTYFYKGKKVGEEIGHSDLLAMFRLKKLNPQYRDNHTQKINVDVSVRAEISMAKQIMADPESRRQAIALSRKLALPAPELIEPATPTQPSEVVDDQRSDDDAART